MLSGYLVVHPPGSSDPNKQEERQLCKMSNVWLRQCNTYGTLQHLSRLAPVVCTRCLAHERLRHARSTSSICCCTDGPNQ